MYCSVNEVINKIEGNYAAANELLSLLNDTKLDDEDRLEIIEILAWFLSENITGLYASHTIEEHIATIGRRIDWTSDVEVKPNNYIFVMTSASYGGGSTVLVHNWIKWDKERRYSVVFTNMNSENVPSFLEEAVEASGGALHFLSGSYTEKATGLLNISACYEKVILVHHQADIIPNLAYSNPNWKRPILMYNHANFKFSLGYEISDAVLHLGITDKEKTVKYRGVDENDCLVLQFPNGGKMLGNCGSIVPNETDRNIVREKYGIDPQKKLVVTMGEQFKLSNIIDCSFVDFVKLLVNEVMHGEIQYIIIGPDPNDMTWKDLAESTKGLARAVGYIRREEAYAIISMADFYVPGFPMLSAGSFIAEELNRPYLVYSLIKRDSEFLPNKIVSSVNELVSGIWKTIVLGENDCYGKSGYKFLGQKEWIQAWEAIDNIYYKHVHHCISPMRYIETEEIINLQLLENSASFRNYMCERNIPSNIFSTLYNLEKKYGYSFLPKTISAADINNYRVLDKYCGKNIKLFHYTSRWMRMELGGQHIADYLCKRGYSSVSIYGMGIMGMNLYDVLSHSNFQVECFIDKSAKKLRDNQYFSNIPCLDYSEIPSNSDIIINTAVVNETEIRNSYVMLPDCMVIISLFDIIDEMAG